MESKLNIGLWLYSQLGRADICPKVYISLYHCLKNNFTFDFVSSA